MNERELVLVTGAAHGIGKAIAERLAVSQFSVVATDTDGLRDVIIDGETGVLTAGERRAFAAAILDLLALPGRRAELGANAHGHVGAVYGWDDVADRFARAYRDICAG